MSEKRKSIFTNKSSAGKGDSSLSGFGVVTMASLFPIIAVLILDIYVSQTTSVDEIISIASMADFMIPE